mmetsp:Transcript_100111/g.250949  ORF Transcript_100111/g.250949 Transcript_100111/m.250949 type:complete len:295 (-) Transcript_100111:13-897(-)
MLMIKLLNQMQVVLKHCVTTGRFLRGMCLAVLIRESGEQSWGALGTFRRTLHGMGNCEKAVDVDGNVCFLRLFTLLRQGQIGLWRGSRLEAQVIHYVLVGVRPESHMPRMHVPTDRFAQDRIPIEGQVVIHSAKAAMMRVERKLLAHDSSHERIALVGVMRQVREERLRRPCLAVQSRGPLYVKCGAGCRRGVTADPAAVVEGVLVRPLCAAHIHLKAVVEFDLLCHRRREDPEGHLQRNIRHLHLDHNRILPRKCRHTGGRCGKQYNPKHETLHDADGKLSSTTNSADRPRAP